MQKLIVSIFLLVAGAVPAQTTDDLLKEGEKNDKQSKEAAVIFNFNKAINANTTEMVGKGKMEFVVAHNFGDFAGDRGGLSNFFGLDDSKDIRIGFYVGLGKNLDVSVSRLKGVGNANHLVETAIKYRLMQQTVDNSIPFSLAFFANNAISTKDADGTGPGDENYFQNFGDRNSQVFQLILAKKIGKISVQLNPTFLNTNYVLDDEDKSYFSLGGAIRFPVSQRVNIIVDYFHSFRSQTSRDSAIKNYGSKIYNPLGIGVEVLTGGHVFHLNFTNAEAILENQFLRRTLSTWSKGQFRWGFNISRTFTLWREK